MKKPKHSHSHGVVDFSQQQASQSSQSCQTCFSGPPPTELWGREPDLLVTENSNGIANLVTPEGNKYILDYSFRPDDPYFTKLHGLWVYVSTEPLLTMPANGMIFNAEFRGVPEPTQQMYILDAFGRSCAIKPADPKNLKWNDRYAEVWNLWFQAPTTGFPQFFGGLNT